MTKEDFGKQWDRLVANLDHGKLTAQQIRSRHDESWRAFSHHSLERFTEAVTTCIKDPEQQWFPTVGAIQRCLNDTAPAPSTMDPNAPQYSPAELAALQEENARWWREEILPMVNSRFVSPGKKARDGEE